MFLKVIVISLFTFLAVCVLAIGWLSYKVQSDPRQKLFLAGKIPAEYPDGLYKGSTGFSQDTWKGKKFNSKDKTGVNIVKNGESEKEAFPFVMSIGPGSIDSQIETLKINYNLPENSFFIRLILDEVVLVSPNHYLGKVGIRIWPGKVVPVGYFELDQN